jgi:hypothetical protein
MMAEVVLERAAAAVLVCSVRVSGAERCVACVNAPPPNTHARDLPAAYLEDLRHLTMKFHVVGVVCVLKRAHGRAQVPARREGASGRCV